MHRCAIERNKDKDIGDAFKVFSGRGVNEGNYKMMKTSWGEVKAATGFDHHGTRT